jgi:hypothetical protein
LALRLALPASFVPSTAITPTLVKPFFAHSDRTAPNRPAIASWWRSTNRAIVA